MDRLLKVALALMLALTILSFKSAPKKVDPKNDIAPHVVAWRSTLHKNRRLATGFHLKLKNKVYIVTNKHVCDSHIRLYKHNNIQFNDYVGKILKIDKDHDLCLVTSNRKDGLRLSMKALKPMEELYLVGHPRGLHKTIRKGRLMGGEFIRAPWMKKNHLYCQQISATAYRGNSGSPVTNMQGKVVGVLFAGSPAYPTEPFIVPHEYLIGFLIEYM